VRGRTFLLAAALAALACGNVHAQDAKATHGGVISRGDDDVSAELVAEGDRVVLYVQAGGKPLPTAGATGTLRRLARPRAPQDEVKLIPAGDNMLSASGVQLRRGDQLRAQVVFPNGEERVFAFTYW